MNGVGLPIAYPLNKEDGQKFRVYQLISMVIENLKHKWLLDASAIFKKLSDSGSISYLSEGYDCLHTLSIERIIDDIEVMSHEKERG